MRRCITSFHAMVVAGSVLLSVSGFSVNQKVSRQKMWKKRETAMVLRMNLFDDLGAMLTGGKLASEVQLPFDPPLCQTTSICDEKRVLAVQERPLSFTGEDFDVWDTATNTKFATVRGAMLHLPGKDKMTLKMENGNSVVLDRKLVSMTPTYDIYRDDGTKWGWIEKEAVAITDTFDIYLEGAGFGPFKAPPTFKLEGDFLQRNFVMKNNRGEVVAKISEDWIIEFDAFNHYSVQIAQGMDAALVIACLCAVDEEFDEEHKENKKSS